LRTSGKNKFVAMSARPSILTRNLDLVAARTAVCMAHEDVAAGMGTTKSVVSRI